MDEVLAAARQIVDLVQEALPVKAHIAGDALPVLARRHAAVRWPTSRRSLARFEELTGGACDKETRARSARRRASCWNSRGGAEAAPAPSRSPLLRQRESRPAGPGGRILVVDDDAENREILARRLEREGF